MDKRGGADLLAGLVIGLIVIGIIITVGAQTGAAINPARYTGTLITSQLAGLNTDWAQAWVYWTADVLGGLAGVFAYDLLATPRRIALTPRRMRRPHWSRRPSSPTRDPIAIRVIPEQRGANAMSVAAQVVKKFINDPDDRRPGGAGRNGRRPSRRCCGSTSTTSSCIRADAPVAGQGRPGLRRRLGSRAAARRLRRRSACSMRPVPGAVFTSPVPDQMAAATRAVDGGAGVLHIVKNYTGDVLNFRMAAELAEDDGHPGRERV